MNPVVDPRTLRSLTTDELLEVRDRLVSAAAAAFELGDTAAGRRALCALEHATVDDVTLHRTDRFLAQIAAGRRVVATCDATRTPASDEVVIVYGNYPQTFANLVVNNPIKRHLSDFWAFRHDRVESDRRWEPIDQIYVINLDDRKDRFDAVLVELARARAPLDRVTRLSASRPAIDESGAFGGHLGCLRSHLECLERARQAGCAHALIVEDDFCFTSDLEEHLNDLSTFFARGYEYWVCLLATSKYGPIVPLDDLVSLSFQSCTNAAAYLVSNNGLTEVIRVFEEGLANLKATGRIYEYSADRCWAPLQASERFLVFRRKLGFQRSSFSDIERTIARYLD
jgi:hypothetical protein